MVLVYMLMALEAGLPDYEIVTNRWGRAEVVAVTPEVWTPARIAVGAVIAAMGITTWWVDRPAGQAEKAARKAARRQKAAEREIRTAATGTAARLGAAPPAPIAEATSTGVDVSATTTTSAPEPTPYPIPEATSTPTPEPSLTPTLKSHPARPPTWYRRWTWWVSVVGWSVTTTRTRILLATTTGAAAVAVVASGVWYIALRDDAPPPASLNATVGSIAEATATPVATSTPAPTAEADSTAGDTSAPTATSPEPVPPTPPPTAEPTPAPTAAPTSEPPSPTAPPAAAPAPDPTAPPTAAPTPPPTPEATPEPSPPPTAEAASPPAAEPEARPTASTGALPTEQLPIAEFVRGGAAIAELPIETPPQSEYHIGLSGRRELAGRGMLFRYEDPRPCSFWMQNTWIDLDIAFAGADAVLFGIHRMTVEDDPANPQRILRSERDCMYAIEAPAGWFEAHGVAVGDRLRLLPAPPSE